MIMSRVEWIASVCHEVNRAYCRSMGDNSQPAWEDAPDWQKVSAIRGVEAHLAEPGGLSPEQSHASWLATKQAEGWKWGPIKDTVKQEHPCMVAYELLPDLQRAKDFIFAAIVAQLRG